MTIMRYCALILLTGFAFACYDKPNAPTASPDNTNKINDTLYVEVKPEWTGFNNPSDVLVGSEPFIYVADTYNNRVVMMDLAGRLVGYSSYIKNPTKLAQNGYFDLYVCGEKDTTLNGKTATIGAIFKIKLMDAKHEISKAKVELAYSEASKPQRRFTGVAVMPDNSYLVTRVGPDNSSPFDPDNSIIIIDKNDVYLSPISWIKPVGNALNSIMDLSGISMANSKSKDFIFVQTGANMQYKAQWYVFSTGEVSDWSQKFDPSTTQNDFLQVDKFSSPEDVTYDYYGNIYIIDSKKDSLYKFTLTGKEKNSFGGLGSGERQFNNPKGVAFFDKTLYIADAGNNRIVRYRLSTDL